MNGNYYQNPTFPTNQNPMQNQNQTNLTSPPGNISSSSYMPMEQSYIENILRLNKGKRVNVYMSYSDSNEWRDKVYSGIIEEAGRDHLIISDSSTGNWYLLRMIYLDYVEFMEKINYSHSYSDKTF